MTTGGGRVRQTLVAGQVAAAVLLLFCAGLLLRTLAAVEAVDRGYRANQVLTMIVDPLGSRYPTDAALLQFFDAVEKEVRSVAGVRSVAWATTLPLGESTEGSVAFEVVGAPLPDRDVLQTANHQIVSTGYFDTVDLPIVDGRAFSDLDTSGTGPVCIVNEAFARKYLRDRSPIGARIAVRPAGFTQAPAITREIVGVARQVKGRPDETDDLLQIYVPIAQNPVNDIYLAVRPSSGSAASLASGVRAAIARVDRDQLVSVRDVTTLEDIAWSAGARHRFRAILVGTFAALALLLTMVGVCGILAYAVQQRVRDFGVRRALGATTGNVLRLAVGSSIGVVGTGAAVGLALAAAVGRLLTAVLFGVRPLDPMTLGVVAFALLAATALSMAGPAWRAIRIEPATALRGE